MKNKACAEIIESSLSNWLARSWKWDYSPSFGSLMTLNHNNMQLFGVVHHIEHGTSDASRQPFIYQKTEQELMVEQPQIFEFLMTTFSMAPVGYLENNIFYYQLPPLPPKIHTFTGHATQEQELLFFSNPAFLHTLFSLSGSINNLDELLLALLKNSVRNNANKNHIESFIQTFSQLAHNDYSRVKLFCQRAQTFLGD